MASKETKFSSTWRYFLKTTFWGGLAGGLSMATGEIWLGYNFHDSDYFFPFVGSAILASSVNGLDSAYRLWKSLSVSRAFKRPTYAAVPLYAPDQPGRRAIPVTAGNNKQRNIFARTVEWFAGNVEDDPDLIHRRVKYDRFMQPEEKVSWTILLSNYNRRRPIIISEDFFFLWLSQVWDRQHDKQTQHTALSRPYFLQAGYGWPEYLTMVKLASHSIWGRGEGSSGYLTAPPQRVVNRTIQVYPPTQPISL